jgi:SecD/SecF fusion protein
LSPPAKFAVLFSVTNCIQYDFIFSELPLKGKIGKYLLIFLPLVIAGFLLWPTYRAAQLESAREKIQQSGDSVALVKWDEEYLDDLRSARDQRLKLGLDLRGGMYVTLEVDIIKLLQESAQRDAVDEIFQEVLDKTRRETANTDDPVLDVFMKNFDQIARPKGRTLLSYFEIGDMRNPNEETIKEKLQANIDDAVNQAQEVVRQRIDKFGVLEPTIQKQGNRRIVLELPGVKDEGEIRRLLQTSARLEFKLVRNNAEIVRAFAAIDNYLVKSKSGQVVETPAVPDTTAAPDSTTIASADSTSVAKDSTAVASTDSTKTDSAAVAAAKADTSNPYATYYIENGQYTPVAYMQKQYPEGEYSFMLSGDNVAKFEQYLAIPAVRRLISSEYQIAIAANADVRAKKQGSTIYDFYALKSEPELTGDVLTEAVATFDQSNNTPMVMMDMSAEGADRWARITGNNIKKRIAIVLDDRVYSAPTVQNKITGGRSQITGSANIEEARLLAIILKAGALKAPVQIVEERVVGPSLGADQIQSGLMASAIACGLVILFMILYYSTGGLIADLAVVINVIVIVALLSAFGGTLTLPGIGGLILTVGMAVDANILIFERIREELRRGRSLKAAVDEGYSKALSSILDSNITTFITGVILFYFGTGPVQGFAVTLMIGIIMTLFTAIMITRAVFNLMIAGGTQHINFGQPSYNAQS